MDNRSSEFAYPDTAEADYYAKYQARIGHDEYDQETNPMETSVMGEYNDELDASVEYQPSPASIEEMAKQRYLVSEIIERGYDQTTFTEFLKDQRGGNEDALDVNSWTFEELGAVVAQFQEQMEAEVEDPNPPDEEKQLEETKRASIKEERRPEVAVLTKKE